jgi:hypothetical protein
MTNIYFFVPKDTLARVHHVYWRDNLLFIAASMASQSRGKDDFPQLLHWRYRLPWFLVRFPYCILSLGDDRKTF